MEPLPLHEMQLRTLKPERSKVVCSPGSHCRPCCACTEKNGDPGMTRTCDLRFRKPPLYPAELRDRSVSLSWKRHLGLHLSEPAPDRQWLFRCPAAFRRAGMQRSPVSPVLTAN